MSYMDATREPWAAYIAAHERYRAAHRDYAAAADRAAELRELGNDPTTPEGQAAWNAGYQADLKWEAAEAARIEHDQACADYDLAHHVAAWAADAQAEPEAEPG